MYSLRGKKFDASSVFQIQADLNSVEAAFSDLHRRYEKLKGAVENYKKVCKRPRYTVVFL